MSLLGLGIANAHLDNQAEIINNQKLQLGQEKEVSEKLRHDGKITCVVSMIFAIPVIILGFVFISSMTLAIINWAMAFTFILIGISVKNENYKKADLILQQAKEKEKKREQQIIKEERLRAKIRAEIEAEARGTKKSTTRGATKEKEEDYYENDF